MTSFDTTATTQGYAWLYEGTPNTPGKRVQLRSSGGLDQRILIAFRMPNKPSGGIERISRTKLTFSVRVSQGTPFNRVYDVYRATRLWVDADSTGTATWNRYSTGANWSSAGGDLDTKVGVKGTANLGTLSSVSFDITSLDLDWGDNASFIIRDAVEDGAGSGFDFFGEPGDAANPTSTYALIPQIVVTAEDEPPAAINDLTVSPDVSLSEASYTFRRRAVLRWSAAK
jgi:hypothetical protein